jgi:hypothetical protein
MSDTAVHLTCGVGPLRLVRLAAVTLIAPAWKLLITGNQRADPLGAALGAFMVMILRWRKRGVDGRLAVRGVQRHLTSHLLRVIRGAAAEASLRMERRNTGDASVVGEDRDTAGPERAMEAVQAAERTNPSGLCKKTAVATGMRHGAD